METMANSKQGVVDLGPGAVLHYQESGDGSPILLIHGTGGRAWFDSPGRLAASHRVIEYDRRGFGASSALTVPGYLERQVADAASLIEALGLSRLTVVGHSWGGIVALGLAARRPELVSRLALMEPPFHAKRNPTAAFLATFLKIQALRRFSGPESAAGAFLRFAMGRTDGVRSYDLIPEEARAELLRNAKGTMIELDAGTGEELTDDSIRGIKQPVLILKAACSQPIFRKVTDRLAALLPQAQVRVLPAAGHMMQFDQPAEFEAAVLDVAG